MAGDRFVTAAGALPGSLLAWLGGVGHQCDRHGGDDRDHGDDQVPDGKPFR